MRLVGISGMTGVSEATLEEYGRLVSKACPEARVDILSRDVLPEEEIIRKLQGYEVLMSGFQPMTEKAYAETGLRAYCACSIGFDFTNPRAASRHQVLVTNNPEYCVAEVAEHAVALILNCARGIYKMGPLVKGGHWGFPALRPLSRFAGSTVGLYGFGRIPRLIARRLAGFEVDIVTCDPFVSAAQAEAGGARLVDFEELIRASDYLSLHAPLTEATRGVFSEPVFRKMKATAYLINTARGPIVDQEALYRALAEGWIKGAGLDVLENEPPTDRDRRIIELPNVTVTGHSAFYSDESLARQTVLTAENIVRVLKGERPENVVNPEVLELVDWIAQ
ncbi:MAG: C-terminal binding protein [Candidatus Adiutrix sp.]|nr:C-terminal binding protein [Candidatus Adiutrix sp.]